MNELLALLGLAWPRLLLYPGGLIALALVWLWRLGEARGTRREAIGDRGLGTREQKQKKRQQLWPFPQSLFPSPQSLLPILNSAPPLLAISLLPLPLAASLGRGIDLVVALTLLEWPLFARLSSRTSALDDHHLQRLRVGYGLLLPALLALVQSTRSFSLDALVARSGALEVLPMLLRLAGACGWALALVPLLALGPFREEETPALDDDIRAIGHIMLATLPVLPLLGDWWWLAPLAPLALGILLRAIDHFAVPHSRLWQHVLGASTLLLWLLLAWASLDALLARAL